MGCMSLLIRRDGDGAGCGIGKVGHLQMYELCVLVRKAELLIIYSSLTINQL